MITKPEKQRVRRFLRAGLALCGLAVIAVAVTRHPPRQQANDAQRENTLRAAFLARLPVAFEPNRGQAAPEVRFVARSLGYSATLLSEGIEFHGASCKKPIRLSFSGKRSWNQPKGMDELPGKSNYYLGSNPTDWHVGIPQYRRVEYPTLYSGIDLVVHGTGGELEYDWIVAPGADPTAIEVRFDSVVSLRVDDEGGLVVRTPCGDLHQRVPVAYQDEGRRRPVAVRYKLTSANSVALSVGLYDRASPLIIDPSISLAVLVGSSAFRIEDGATGIAVAADGSLFVTGQAVGTAFPVTTGSVGTGGFVLRVNSSGTSLLYSTVLGMTLTGVAVDQLGNAYVTGNGSTGYPVTANAMQPQVRGVNDAVLSKLDPTGRLLYSSFFGGSNEEGAYGIGLDGSGNIYMMGSTSSPDFPVTSAAFQRTSGKGFVAKFSNDGTALIACTRFGGSAFEQYYGIAVDSAGNAYVTGGTQSADFPTTPGSFQSTFVPIGPGFVMKVNPSLSALIYSTFLPQATPKAIALDSTGSAYLTGSTSSGDFPVVNAFQPRIASGGGFSDAFVTKLAPDGSRLIYSTYLGGSQNDGASGIAVDASGAAYVTGGTLSADFPQVDSLQAELDGGNCLSTSFGCGDAFLAKIRPDGSALVYSTFVGGGYSDGGAGVAVDGQGNAYVTGFWLSRGFLPTSVPTPSSGRGVFIMKVAPSGSMPLISFRGITNGASFRQGLVQNGIATIFGKGITNVTGILTASTLPLPRELNGVSVSVNGVRMPLFAIANVNGQEQINFQAPTPITPDFVFVVNNGVQSLPVTINFFGGQPGIFTIDGSTGAIQHGSTYQQVSSSNPAKRGEVLIIYATGLGAVSPDPGLGNPAPSSPPSVTTRTPTATIGGVEAPVQFSGLTPGFVGLNQVNVQVPQGTASGMVDVVLTMNFPSASFSSPAVKLAVESAQAPRRSRRER